MLRDSAIFGVLLAIMAVGFAQALSVHRVDACKDVNLRLADFFEDMHWMQQTERQPRSVSSSIRYCRPCSGMCMIDPKPKTDLSEFICAE